MHSFLADIPAELRPGNVMSVPILRRYGISKNNVATLVRRGELTRLRQNWYAAPMADEHIERAVRSGGVLGCVSALVKHGAWEPLDKSIHVYRTQKGRREPSRGVGWCPIGTRAALNVAVAPINIAMAQALRCCSDVDALVLMESLVKRGRVGWDEGVRLLGRLGHRMNWADSGTETMLRYALEERGLPVRPQVHIEGVGRVDLLVGDRLIIEVDSYEHHHNKQTYYDDRQRDQNSLALGYLTVRVTWEQVMEKLAEVLELICHLTARGDHWRR